MDFFTLDVNTLNDYSSKMTQTNTLEIVPARCNVNGDDVIIKYM